MRARLNQIAGQGATSYIDRQEKGHILSPIARSIETISIIGTCQQCSRRLQGYEDTSGMFFCHGCWKNYNETMKSPKKASNGGQSHPVMKSPFLLSPTNSLAPLSPSAVGLRKLEDYYDKSSGISRTEWIKGIKRVRDQVKKMGIDVASAHLAFIYWNAYFKDQETIEALLDNDGITQRDYTMKLRRVVKELQAKGYVIMDVKEVAQVEQTLFDQFYDVNQTVQRCKGLFKKGSTVAQPVRSAHFQSAPHKVAYKPYPPDLGEDKADIQKYFAMHKVSVDLKEIEEAYYRNDYDLEATVELLQSKHQFSLKSRTTASTLSTSIPISTSPHPRTIVKQEKKVQTAVPVLPRKPDTSRTQTPVKSYEEKSEASGINSSVNDSLPVSAKPIIEEYVPPKTGNTTKKAASSFSPPASTKHKLFTEAKRADRSKRRAKLLEENKKIPNLNCVIVGHVDAGKSTLMGHLLVKLDRVTSKELHKHKKEAGQSDGAKVTEFMRVMDLHEEERERGITVDVSVNYFVTKNRHVTILDCPGHRDFIPNMITGAAQADCAILVVNASNNEFEAGFKDNAQTREHAILLNSLGIKQVIVAINKMDTVNWDKTRYEVIKWKMSEFLGANGFRVDRGKVRFVPLSGLKGLNLTELTPSCAWYTGKTLFEMIDTFKPKEGLVKKPLRMSIMDVFRHGTLGWYIVTGKLESGSLMPGDEVLVLTAATHTTVKGILNVDGDKVPVAKAGDNVQIGLNLEELNHVSPGDMLCCPYDPIPVVKKFRAKVQVQAQVRVPLLPGTKVIIHLQNVEQPGTIKKIVKVEGSKSKGRPRCVVAKQTAEIILVPDRPLCVEKYSKFKNLGRVTLRRTGKTVAVGLIL